MQGSEGSKVKQPAGEFKGHHDGLNAVPCPPGRNPVSMLDPNFDMNSIRDVSLDLSPVKAEDKLAFLLKGVFTPEECNRLIELGEDVGFGPAYVNSGGRAVLATGYRDGARVLIDDPDFAKVLMTRIQRFLPDPFQDEKLVQINERLRFLRYEDGDKFLPHCDGTYTRPDYSAKTLITLQIYLNDDFNGGETTFLRREKGHYDKFSFSRVPVVPEPGMILVFEHNILHEGSKVKDGMKYTIRMDVLYTINSKQGI